MFRGALYGLIPVVVALILVRPVHAQCPSPTYDCNWGCDLVQSWSDCLDWYQCGQREGPSCPVCLEIGFDVLQPSEPGGPCNYLCGYQWDWLCGCVVYCVE
jgi:hypothetical protein